MSQNNLIATAEITLNSSADQVWDALVNPEKIKKYMFGTNVESDWRTGSSIVWKGEWKGKAYEDKGKIIEIQPNQRLKYTHFSPMTGEEDKPENYHTVTVELQAEGKQTKLILMQDKNKSEKERDESRNNWNMMLQSLKAMIEKEQ